MVPITALVKEDPTGSTQDPGRLGGQIGLYIYIYVKIHAVIRGTSVQTLHEIHQPRQH